MINLFEAPDLKENLTQLHRFFNAKDPLGGINSRHIPKLENKFANITGKQAIAVNHCTNGLYLALSQYKPSTVVLPGVGFFGVAGAIQKAGHTVYFAPVDATGNLDLSFLDFNKLSEQTIILNVHLNSRVVDLRDCSLTVIEDAASAFGSCYNDGADVIAATPHDAVVSFSYSKPITSGEGGMILTRDNESFYRSRRYCGLDNISNNYGLVDFDVTQSDIKYPFNAVNAALITLQLKNYKKHLEIRRTLSKELDSITREYNKTLSYQLGNCVTYMLRFDSETNRNRAKKFLEESGVQCYLSHVPTHRLSAFSKCLAHPATEATCDDYYSKVLHIPCRSFSAETKDKYLEIVSKMSGVLK